MERFRGVIILFLFAAILSAVSCAQKRMRSPQFLMRVSRSTAAL